MIDKHWPKWAIAQSQSLQAVTPVWQDKYADLEDKALAQEGQFDQYGYPFDHIVLAKMLCDSAGDDPHLFFKYMSEAGEALNA